MSISPSGNSSSLSLRSLFELSELSFGLPLATDFFGFLIGVPPPLPPLAVLVRVVDYCRPVVSVGPSAASGVGGGDVPPPLAHASRSALSLGPSLGVNFFVPSFFFFLKSVLAYSLYHGESPWAPPGALSPGDGPPQLYT